MKNSIAVVLLSGGMDSTVCTAIARAKGHELACLHVNYGQRTQDRELQAFNEICDHFSASRRLVVDISHLAAIGGSSLTDLKIPVESAHADRKVIPTSYVPFRNANILSIATSWAEVLEASSIYIGAVQDDSSGYPDCRVEFFHAFQKVINAGTKPDSGISIVTPVIRSSKKEIVTAGVQLSVPFELTWSCYQSTDLACGQCDSCALRLRGFQQAQIEDPIRYTSRPSYI